MGSSASRVDDLPAKASGSFAPRPRRWARLLAAVTVLALTAAACGDSGTSGADADGEAGVEVPQGDPDEGVQPQYGGKLVFAREAETTQPWTPANMVCELACHQAARSVYDTLVLVDEEGTAQPFLLESFEPNADFTEWTLVARDGISFHDGTPFDAVAIDDHMARLRASPLVGDFLSDVAGQEIVDAMTVTLNMARPWPQFPQFLDDNYVGSPTWLAGVDAGTADAAEPVGTGPFVFAEYRPDNNFRATRNEDYWLSDADGNQYPYLDEIEFLVQSEDRTREDAIIAGDVDLMHMDGGISIERLRGEVESGTLAMAELGDNQEVDYLLLNAAADSPVADVRIRRAMALAIDQDFRNQARAAGVLEIANGPFSPGSLGYLEDTGFPVFDPDRAQELVDEYEAENGPAEIAFTTTSDPTDFQSAQLYQQFWQDVGIDVALNQIEQGQFISRALEGDFEAFDWRNHGSIDPDAQRAWWTSDNALPVGELALNFGRIEDDVIDENLDVIRESSDPAARQAAAEEINRRFAEQVYNIWTDWALWVIPYQDDVHGVSTPLALPDGGTAAPFGQGFTGAINVTQLWVSE
jgi:peptide/nickel transport system substrate-binding protein